MPTRDAVKEVWAWSRYIAEWQEPQTAETADYLLNFARTWELKFKREDELEPEPCTASELSDFLGI